MHVEVGEKKDQANDCTWKMWVWCVIRHLYKGTGLALKKLNDLSWLQISDNVLFLFQWKGYVKGSQLVLWMLHSGSGCVQKGTRKVMLPLAGTQYHGWLLRSYQINFHSANAVLKNQFAPPLKLYDGKL